MGFPHPSHPRETVLLSRYFGDPAARTYAGWVERGGYAAFRHALGMGPDAVVAAVKESG
jgi:NADH-quinone oxidoreductase subunit F